MTAAISNQMEIMESCISMGRRTERFCTRSVVRRKGRINGPGADPGAARLFLRPVFDLEVFYPAEFICVMRDYCQVS